MVTEFSFYKDFITEFETKVASVCLSNFAAFPRSIVLLYVHLLTLDVK